MGCWWLSCKHCLLVLLVFKLKIGFLRFHVNCLDLHTFITLSHYQRIFSMFFFFFLCVYFYFICFLLIYLFVSFSFFIY